MSDNNKFPAVTDSNGTVYVLKSNPSGKISAAILDPNSLEEDGTYYRLTQNFQPLFYSTLKDPNNPVYKYKLNNNYIALDSDLVKNMRKALEKNREE